MARYKTYKHFVNIARILIRKKVTISELSNEINLCERSVYDVLKAMRDLGLDIQTKRNWRTVHYTLPAYEINKLFFSDLWQEDLDT